MEPREWVRSLEPRGVSARSDRARTLVICFPHSGGWAESFSTWREHIRRLDGDVDPPGVELLAVQYPGHGDRIAEEPETDVRVMAEAISAELAALDPVRSLLFGHSFGAMVAYETARLLERAGTAPAALGVSGARAPSAAPAVSHDVAALPDERLWRRVVELGGVDPSLAEDPELRELLLSALRADITAHGRYVSAPPVGRLGVDIRCYLGSEDPLVPGDVGPEWAAWTTGSLATRVRRGGHFHLFENPRDLLADLLRERVGAGSGAAA
ncbi:Surfactin synthase thioesterase subunit [Actinopolyspora alba]|uniref:Surfactin synthase thioesterase subunit n=2 Tax=Actinopolyspora alba TaxID=673379 RepID=A0A1I2AWW7_9ACTN|nr:Surfactin synthase thioesterase subunit [Actinopolyspora alba]